MSNSSQNQLISEQNSFQVFGHSFLQSEINSEARRICILSKDASRKIAFFSIETKNQILLTAAKLLAQKAQVIFARNRIDLKKGKENGLNEAKLDRLEINEARLSSIINSLHEIVKLPDPVGRTLHSAKLANQLEVKRVSVPIGVLLAIYESRPNVTADISALALKAGNSVILRCGSDCQETSVEIAEIFRQAIFLVLRENNFDEEEINCAQNAVILCQNPDRRLVNRLLKMEKFIDVVIPRGGNSLISAVLKNSKIPVFRHLSGNCHTYIHQDCYFEKALKITVNAKMRRVGICGATESVLIDKKIAEEILPKLVEELTKMGCEIRGDKLSMRIDSRVKKAQKSDFYAEYLDKILSLKIVKNLDEAILHINKHSSSHTESIITENKQAAEKFMNQVDSAILMHNASTQFADGFELGLGAEVGIATGKLHARGPVGLEQLTTYKYLVEADFGIRG